MKLICERHQNIELDFGALKDGTVKVIPCNKCLEDARDEGYDEGYDAAAPNEDE